jgi:hypothetical protein
MEQLIELSPTEIKLAFVASCIEGTARRLGKSYQEIYARMKSVGMIANYILPNYEVLHTESREHVTDNMINTLVMMEQNLQNDPVKSPVIQEMILSNRIGCISAELAKRLNIAPERALELFYESKTCADLHNKNTGLYLYGNLYIADEFIREHEYK